MTADAQISEERAPTYLAPAKPALTVEPKARKRGVRKTKSKLNPEIAIMVVVTPDGTFRPSDQYSAKKCRDRGFKTGMELLAFFKFPREPGQWRCAHQIGTFLIQNVEEYSHITDAHKALKKLQQDADIECDSHSVDVPGIGPLQVRVPRSLSFDEMDGGTFTAVFKTMALKIQQKYFQDLDAQVVEDMIKLMPDPA